MKKSIICETIDTLFDFQGAFQKSKFFEECLKPDDKNAYPVAADDCETLKDARKKFMLSEEFGKLKALPGSKEFLSEMKKKGYKIYILTKNSNELMNKNIIREFGKDFFTDFGIVKTLEDMKEEDFIFISKNFHDIFSFKQDGGKNYYLFGKQYDDYNGPEWSKNRIKDWSEAEKVIEAL